MILTIEGTEAKYYIQTICLIFFPGSKFGENEEAGDDVPEVSVSVSPREGGGYRCYAKIAMNGEEVSAEAEAAPDETVKTQSRLEKLAIGRAVFEAGKKFFRHAPPWGILTGVRPSKVAMELLADGHGVQRSRRILRDEYFVNPKKAALAVSVANAEAKLIKKLDGGLCSVYISIPFCPSRCSYCSFISASVQKLFGVLDDYLEHLIGDVAHTFETIRMAGLRVATVYIGGGTPTVLSERQLEKLLLAISREVDPASLMEYTLEAGRPDTINAEKLRIAREYGVTRISVNPQTLSDEVLQNVGRRHTVADFFRAWEVAVASGIRDINVDLIAGLPGDTFAGFAYSLDTVISLAPSNLTVHTLAVKNAASLRETGYNLYSLTGGDTAKMVEYSQLEAKLAGYRPYYMYRQKNSRGNLENVGFCLEGREGYYNVFMMEELHSIFAVGAGAVTKLVDRAPGENGRIERIFVPKYPYEYLRDMDKIREGAPEEGKLPLREKILAFFAEGK